MFIVGLDGGFDGQKICTGVGKNDFETIKSTVKKGYDPFSSSLKVDYEGQKFTVGDNNGKTCGDLIKINDPKSQILTYTSIAEAMKKKGKSNEDIALIVGLPSGQHEALKKELRESLLNKEVKIMLDFKEYYYKIAKVLVMAQCSGYFLIEDLEGEYLVFDFGGMTLDVTHFSNGQPGEKHSYPVGSKKLYGKITADLLNKGVNYENYRAEEAIKTKKITTKNGEVDYDPSVVINNHIEDAIDLVKNDFPYDNMKRIWIGGTSMLLKEWLVGENVKEDGLYANAKIYYMAGVIKFGEEK